MASITARDLSQNIDVSQVSVKAREQWEKQQRKRLSIEQTLIRLLPIGLIIMVAVFFLLSAPHTVDMLDMITPGFGIVAPVGFEIGILVIAALIEAGWRGWLTYPLLGLLMIMAIMINTAGAFMVVVGTSGNIQNQTFMQLFALYPTLPAATQAVLFLVIPVGVAVPVISKFAGEAVVKLALGKVELSKTSINDLWSAVEQREVRSALMQAALDMGAGVKTAGKWASDVAEQLFYMESVTAVSTQTVSYSDRPAHVTSAQLAGQQDSGTGQDRPHYGFLVSSQSTPHNPEWTAIDKKDSPGQGTAGQTVLTKQMVKHWIEDNPGAWREMSNHAISQDIIGNESGYKTVQRTLRALNLRR